MSVVKKEALKLVEELSENEGWEDLMYKIYVRESIEQGLNDVNNGKVYSIEEAEKRLSKWLK